MKKYYFIALVATVCACNQVTAQIKLSLNKPTMDSTTENSSYPPSNAVDSDTTTKWSSSYSYKQWLYVDLQATCDIKKVTIQWADGCYATVFDIFFSLDAANWTLAKTFPSNTNGTFLSIDGLSGQARYVKFLGRGRANTLKGYRISDFSVYGYLPATTAQQTEINTLTTRLLTRYAKKGVTTSEVSGYFNTILTDGRWSDLSYTTGGNWLQHPDRLQKMALAYNKPGNLYYHDTAMLNKVAKGLSYLRRKHPGSGNWYDTTVAAPEGYMTALIIVKNDLNPDSAQLYSTYLLDATDNYAHQGMNRAWVSGITIHKGCIEKRYWLVDKGYSSMSDCLNIVTGTDKEGVMADGSFHQHHDQLYTGGYGKTMLEYLAYYLRHSDSLSVNTYFTQAKRQTLTDLFLGGLQLLSYGKNVDFGSAGREVSRNNSTSMLISTPMMDTMALNDTANATAYLNWRDHINGVGDFPSAFAGTKYFWKSAILTSHNTGFYMSAKIISSRTYGTEGIGGKMPKVIIYRWVRQISCGQAMNTK
ncbi:discoidin domain-containing protein [Paraflavitalea speifideaquila]|uniref:discoidin domain-containing protein n=1 Tax=Paraflavitalea speifideaquila TaxID=3076558 RepID=UPI0028ECD8A1|nr:discoidin domain-containing protein [Paraflavitalea speifideiaquila]